MLRAAGRVQIDYAENAEQCLMALSYCQPDVLIADLQLRRRRRPRLGGTASAPAEGGQAFRKLSIIIVAAGNSAAGIAARRNLGVDEFVSAPSPRRPC